MRAFIAFDLAIRVVENLILLQEDLHRPLNNAGARPRWIDASNIHLTVKFLGEIEEPLLFRIRDTLANVAKKHAIFDIATIGTGCFPDPKRPRIIWAGTGDGDEAALTLQRDLEESLDELGIARETRPFHPHVTIGRIKTRQTRVDIEPILSPYRDTVFGNSQVKDFALFKSTLNAKGAVYDVIERFPLTGS